jgi:hypothetical protein
MVTERDALVALLNAVTGLAEKLTGERMTIHLKTEAGETIDISGASVSWTPVDATADRTVRAAA